MINLQLRYTIVAINNVEVKKIKSDGYVGLSQLQKKWFQHLDDVYTLWFTNLLQKIKQYHVYFHVFVGRSPICLFGVGGLHYKMFKNFIFE